MRTGVVTGAGVTGNANAPCVAVAAGDGEGWRVVGGDGAAGGIFPVDVSGVAPELIEPQPVSSVAADAPISSSASRRLRIRPI